MKHSQAICWRGGVLTGPVVPHQHTLPVVPAIAVSYPSGDMEFTRRIVHQTNAVAQCSGCGVLFVSKFCDDERNPSVYWIRLRWWNRTAHRTLRAAS